MLPKLCR